MVDRLRLDDDRRRLTPRCVVVRRPRTLSRFAVVGGPGSGKTTLAAALAVRLGLVHVELDALWWGPDWQHVTPDELAARVDAQLAAAPDGWIADGNYLDEVARTLVWRQADQLVWLDRPRPLAFQRTVRRTAHRLVHRTPLWQNNHETARNLTPVNLVRLWRRWPTYGTRIAALLDELGPDGPDVVRLRSDGEVSAWLDYVSAV